MRLPWLQTVSYLFALVREGYFLTPLQKRLRDHVLQENRHRRVEGGPVILVQCVEDYFYFGVFSKIAAGLRKCGPLRVDQYSLHSLRQGSSVSLRRFFWNNVRQNFITDRKWRALYRAFADRTAYSATGWVAPWTALRLWVRAFRLWRSLKDVDELAKVSVQDIWIGDLLIDSYIRFKPTARLDVTDPYLLIIIRQALKDIAKASRYLRKTRPALLLTSYSTYIQHGIPARVAAQFGTRVLAFSNYQDFTAEITPASPWQTRSGASYKRDFALLPDPESKIAAASQQMQARLRGEIDKATGYMKTSAYGRTGDIGIDVGGMPVIFLHDFSDSIHIYRWISFHDFWDWICFTIDTLQAAGIAFAIKPHPNQLSDPTRALEMLCAKYPGLNLVPVDISNRQLMDAGMACAVTVYGTIASEMAFMGIPTISCGDNPHISFGFCHTASSREEYAAALMSYKELGQPLADMRRESCAFYYMHNLHLDADYQILRDRSLELRRRLSFSDTPLSLSDILDAMEQFASGPVFEEFCAGLYRGMMERAHLGATAKAAA